MMEMHKNLKTKHRLFFNFSFSFLILAIVGLISSYGSILIASKKNKKDEAVYESKKYSQANVISSVVLTPVPSPGLSENCHLRT